MDHHLHHECALGLGSGLGCRLGLVVGDLWWALWGRVAFLLISFGFRFGMFVGPSWGGIVLGVSANDRVGESRRSVELLHPKKSKTHINIYIHIYTH